ncbi:cardiolipin synthase [Panacibacter ginsenosidivorans]|uniref:Cardiolipin synthase n=1 Tax=Panacibacter ginsenosidivorans TaxID=1813871 RepID=A0A5B8V5W2_9BACT|nr:cardiolipin synthase [Panacibacter ginsenosidivorans]QEC66599.1 cardiolipin synthase [Panacibacter ginsenosidivorans]
MNYKLILLIVYCLILLVVCLRILYETQNSSKTIAYLFVCIFFPVFGILFYLAFGINYWKKKRYSKKMNEDDKMLDQLKKKIPEYKNCTVDPKDISDDNAELVSMLLKDLRSPLTRNNRIKLLLNGEEKFPELIKCLQSAKHHIHIEYYIFEQDETGIAIIELLIAKAKEGVQVKFIYDDFGSPSIKKKIERKMRDAGIEIFPFSKVHFYLLANRINYRNHRKIVVIDGHTGFVGGINVSDKYVNNGKQKLYWRDTHLRIDGPGVYYLQYIFITDWNFCCGKELIPEDVFFAQCDDIKDGTLIQIASSGPDSTEPSIMFSVIEAISLAKEEILITTPYFIPGDSIINALRIAALGGVTVKLLVPGKCDSRVVNAASKANYDPLLQAGVEIYLYNKGFVHAKTLVTDSKLSIIGTANMDHRSFELNFEVNAIIYDETFSKKMREVFAEDIKYATKLDPRLWYERSLLTQFPEKLARLLSPTL